jgi:Mn2+/Fe2+ NRAMP family transporter
MSMTARRARPAPASDPKKPRIIRLLGPGLITGASDDDPSGIATYSQAGAQFGFAISWTMLFSYPLMVAIQQISARIGRTTGKGIAGNLRQHYPNWLLQGTVALLFVANTINIGAGRASPRYICAFRSTIQLAAARTVPPTVGVSLIARGRYVE